jgi:hypothetical protein
VSIPKKKKKNGAEAMLQFILGEQARSASEPKSQPPLMQDGEPLLGFLAKAKI